MIGDLPLLVSGRLCIFNSLIKFHEISDVGTALNVVCIFIFVLFDITSTSFVDKVFLFINFLSVTGVKIPSPSSSPSLSYIVKLFDGVHLLPEEKIRVFL